METSYLEENSSNEISDHLHFIGLELKISDISKQRRNNLHGEKPVEKRENTLSSHFIRYLHNIMQYNTTAQIRHCSFSLDTVRELLEVFWVN